MRFAFPPRNISWRHSVAALVTLSACDVLAPQAPLDEEALDGPIAVLTPTQLAVHAAGDEEFARRFTSSDGVGPMFVAQSCEQCHVADGKAHPVFTITRFGCTGGGGFDPLVELGGPQLQNRSVMGYPPEAVPPEATGIAGFLAPAVTGLGFLEAVDDQTLLDLADPDDSDGDGISGRVSLIPAAGAAEEAIRRDLVFQSGSARGNVIEGASFIGRFGKKAAAVNLLHQVATAYIQDMGLTTDLFVEDLTNVQAGALAGDVVADPEIGLDVLDAVTFYMKTLRVPSRRNAGAPEVHLGEELFREIGCASCHVPTLTTGAHEVGRLDRVTFHPYTDLLLHDMGEELDDGYTEGSATTSEWRTAPLWGVGLAAATQGGGAFYLHDGRAPSLREAITYHGGGAAASRAAFDHLTAERQDALIAFLSSL